MTDANPASPSTADASPLTPAHRMQIHDAGKRRKVFLKTARVARGMSHTTLFIGALGVVILVFSHNWVSIITVVGICLVGIIEHFASQQLQLANLKAPAILGWNQLFFLALITFYCVMNMINASENVRQSLSSTSSQLPQDMQDMFAGYEQLGIMLTYVFYGLIIVISIFFQGGMALYYWSRKKYVAAYHEHTPQWIREMLAEVTI